MWIQVGPHVALGVVCAGRYTRGGRRSRHGSQQAAANRTSRGDRAECGSPGAQPLLAHPGTLKWGCLVKRPLAVFFSHSPAWTGAVTGRRGSLRPRALCALVVSCAFATGVQAAATAHPGMRFTHAEGSPCTKPPAILVEPTPRERPPASLSLGQGTAAIQRGSHASCLPTPAS